jgi:integrase
VALWARDKGGMVPDDVPWADPFSRMRLRADEPTRESFTPEELKAVFGGPVFTEGARPAGGKGEAAFWLPLLALFTGARRSELAGLTVDNLDTLWRTSDNNHAGPEPRKTIEDPRFTTSRAVT